MIKLLYHVSIPMYIMKVLLLKNTSIKTKGKQALLQSAANIYLTTVYMCFHLINTVLNQEKSQAAEIFLCGTEETDCKGSFQVLICKGKEMIALTFVISMRPALMLIKLKRTYEVVKG